MNVLARGTSVLASLFPLTEERTPLQVLVYNRSLSLYCSLSLAVEGGSPQSRIWSAVVQRFLHFSTLFSCCLFSFLLWFQGVLRFYGI